MRLFVDVERLPWDKVSRYIMFMSTVGYKTLNFCVPSISRGIQKRRIRGANIDTARFQYLALTVRTALGLS